ncbi:MULTISPECIES: DUF5063 domain-containing protein [Nocardioides]|jgi:hypothetical protein|uniref:DUF5063 domain-containing protein n=1 Tax=Nocardioides lianchengensis TaxID=1045774 RepID=A0A1G6Q277_9ACTN|nr:DUF5063 domain-containing protein [Nocardioides lianchengensis]NYG12067.1 hypothetical protein [Nocardioides lianchengensis]SDC86449.1 protein of unknown function [Nocardioides lianchengensis]
MTDTTATEDFAQQIADQVESFLVAIQAISRDEEGSGAISLLLLEVSQLLLAGARLGAQADFEPDQEYQPDVGPDPDLDAMRLRLATLLGPVDTYSYVFDPYVPELDTANLSDELTSVATDVANGLRHFRNGDVAEALWWWQFSYVSSWGTSASASLRALHSIVTHSRLDADDEVDAEVVAVADEMLAGRDVTGR